MKYVLFFICYMLISGLLGGLVHNHHHKRCGTKGSPTTKQMIGAILWPVAIGITITMNDKYYLITKCKGVKQ